MGLQITSGGVYADPEQFASMQRMGDAKLLVEYSVDAEGRVVIDGAWVNGECADADRFSGWQRELWRSDIQRELDSERLAFEGEQLELAL